MHRRHALLTLASLAAGASLPAWSQAPRKVPRVAILHFGSRANFRARAEAFTQAMAERGYVEGKTVAYDWRTANGQEDVLKSHAAELGHGAADVIVSASTHTSRVLRNAGVNTVPVVMAANEEPTIEGFARSIERPGGNFTGVSASVLDHLDRHVELLFAVAPRLTRITALLNPENPAYRVYRARLQSAVRAGTKLIVADAATVDQIDAAFPARARDDADGLIVMNDSMFFNERRAIVDAATRVKRPSIYPIRAFVEAGGLMSYGANPEANYARAAQYVDRILKGAKPAEMPIDPPAKLELVVNRDRLETLGFPLPPEIAKQAIYYPR